MPSSTCSGSPRSCRICRARSITSGVRASSARLAASIEIGKALARTTRWLPSGPGDLDGAAAGVQAEQPAADPQEVVGVRPALEAQQVGAEQPLHDVLAPRQLGEDLDRRGTGCG